MSRTYLHETPAGDKIEFRRVAERIEHRLLKRDGTPHADGWYPVTDAMRLALDRAESDVLRLLE